MKVNILELKAAIENKNVSIRKHPTEELYIYKYKANVTFEKLWNPTISICRGLILDDKYNVISKPFDKFYNKGELDENIIPYHLDYDVFDKLDGSLGISYLINNTPYLATAGSFDSVEALKGTEILHNKYKHLFDKFSSEYTFLFEIIYPKNKVVIEYNDIEDIFLLAVINNDTWLEVIDDNFINSIGFKVSEKYPKTEISKLQELNLKNKEGFVVRFSNGFRMKIKFEDYVSLHKIVTNISNKDVFDYISNNKDMNEILERIPDECYDWVQNVIKTTKANYEEIENYCKSVYKEFDNDKDAALYFLTTKHPTILFNMRYGMDYSHVIYKKIRPKYEKHFKSIM